MLWSDHIFKDFISECTKTAFLRDSLRNRTKTERKWPTARQAKDKNYVFVVIVCPPSSCCFVLFCRLFGWGRLSSFFIHTECECCVFCPKRSFNGILFWDVRCGKMSITPNDSVFSGSEALQQHHYNAHTAERHCSGECCVRFKSVFCLRYHKYDFTIATSIFRVVQRRREKKKHRQYFENQKPKTLNLTVWHRMHAPVPVVHPLALATQCTGYLNGKCVRMV